jgi:hypothetical protein
MLFLLAIEPLYKLFHRAQQMGMLTKLGKTCESFRISLYADDAAVFIKPTERELCITNQILSIFA